MAATLSRDAEGVTKVGDITVTVPKDELAIAVLGNNTFRNGERFETDGWIVDAKGQRQRKWFRYWCGINRVWGPHLDENMAERWEDLYHRLSLKASKKWDIIWDLAQEIKNSEGPTKHDERYCTVPDGKVWKSADGNEYEAYTVSEYGIGHTWVKGPPSMPEFGREFGKKYTYIENLWHRKAIVRSILNECIERRIRRHSANLSTRLYETVCVNLNSRKYWYKSDSWAHCEIIAWPEDIALEI